MSNPVVNPEIVRRFEELIAEGQSLWHDFQDSPGTIMDPVRFTCWTTSCLNLLDRLSASTNRFVTEFEAWAKRRPGMEVNIGASLGVLTAALIEYRKGFAIDYHLAVASAVFGDLLAQADYLHEKGYHRAAVVLAGAALEDSMRVRARSTPFALTGKETLIPLSHILKRPEVGVLTELQAKRIEAVGQIRNDAAHGGDFEHKQEDIMLTLTDIRNLVEHILGER
jgi:hypothetical protein